MYIQPAKNKNYFTLRVASVREETPQVRTLVFAPHPVIHHQSGQFLTLAFQGKKGEERRSYSFSNTPELGEAMAITVKRVPNGRYSRPLTEKINPGDCLCVTGASGVFTIPEDITTRKQLFFFAAGIGIVPVYSLLKALLHLHPHVRVTLIYSNPVAGQTVFYAELIELSRRFNHRFDIEFLFSSSPDLTRARLSKWLLPKLLKEFICAEPDELLFYLCGPFSYMRMVTIGLIEEGFSADQIRKENFDTSRPAMKIQPPDKEQHFVQIILKGTTYTFPVQYPETILEAAKKASVPLSYSCETGRCGSCTLRCTTGKVWMSYNEVLTDRDAARGRVLICTGYPIGGDVTLVAD